MVLTTVVISSKDIDILIIAGYAYAQLATQVCQTFWFMKTDSFKYVNIWKINDFSGL